MYKIAWDTDNNLLVLQKENAFINTEFRPVFSAELDHLGFDSFFSYEKSACVPVLWAVRYHYFYKGKEIAELDDNGCFRAPSVRILDESIIGAHLPLIDICLWFEKNRALMDQLVQDTLLRIYRVYMEWKDRVDYIHVAYSSGKDSTVLLDLVKRVIPHDRFFVSWIDSGMELGYSAETVRREQARCREEGIEFLINRTIMDPVAAWSRIGPPSFDNRWCCSVLQSVPNTIHMKDYVGKKDARSLIYLGNRADESSSRMKSSLVNVGVKHKSQVEADGIINWNSLEVFLYMMMNGVEINQAYIEGATRVGCLLCPRASTIGTAFSSLVCRDEMEPYYKAVLETYRDSFGSEEAAEDYINLGDWRFRRGSKNTKYHADYREFIEDGRINLELKHPLTDWKTWILTMGTVRPAETVDPAPETAGSASGAMQYLLEFRGKTFVFTVREDGDLLDVSFSDACGEEFTRLFKNVFRKALACIGCRTCEVNCPHGHMHFEDGRLVIDDGCLHCAECHSSIHSCYAFDSWFDPDLVL